MTRNEQPRKRKHLELLSIVYGFAVLLLLALWASIWFQLKLEQENIRQHQQNQSQSIVRAFAEHCIYVLRQADHISNLFQAMYSESDGNLSMARFLHGNGELEQVLGSDVDLRIYILNEQGAVIEGSTPLAESFDFSRTDLFEYHANRKSQSVHVSTRMLDYGNHTWVLQLSRRLQDKQGNFAGVISVQIDPINLVDQYDTLELGQAGNLILKLSDDVLAVQRVGQTLYRMNDLHWQVHGDELHGLHSAAIDGIARHYSLRALPQFGLHAAVGLPLAQGEEKFQKYLLIYLSFATLISGIIIVGLGLLKVQTKRLHGSMLAAKKAQAILSSAAEGSLDAFYILHCLRNEQGVITDFLIANVNQRGARLLGRQTDFLLGKKLCELLPMFRSAGYFDQYVKVVNSGAALEEEYEIDIPQIKAQWLHHQIVTIGDGVAITVRDITARKHAELETHNHRNFLRSLVDHLPVLVSVCRIGPQQTSIVVWNKTAEILLGHPAEQVLDKNLSEAFCAEEVALIEKRNHLLLNGNLSELRQEEELIHADGRRCHLQTVSVPLRNTVGEIAYILSIGEDITLRREAELALRESEARLRTITNTMPAMVAYVDAQERYRFHNQAYEREIGIDMRDSDGKAVLDMVGEQRYQVIAPYIHRALAGETVVYEDDLSQNDVYRVLECTYIPQFSQDGQTVLGFHVMRQDITAKKIEEQRLLQLAQLDVLTGLSNRAGFMQKLRDAMALSCEQQCLLGLMYMDIDHFKAVNDNYGHHTGDLLLAAFAKRLCHSLRASDCVARLGGDEFTVIMEKVMRQEDARAVAEKVVLAMRSSFTLDGKDIHISASIGLAFFHGGDASAEAFLNQADMMLYKAKRAGRNTWRAANLSD